MNATKWKAIEYVFIEDDDDAGPLCVQWDGLAEAWFVLDGTDRVSGPYPTAEAAAVYAEYWLAATASEARQ